MLTTTTVCSTWRQVRLHELLIIFVFEEVFLPSRCNKLEQGEEGFSDSDWFLCFLFTTTSKPGHQYRTNAPILSSTPSTPSMPSLSGPNKPSLWKLAKKSFGMQYMNGFLCHPIWKSSHFSQEAFLVQCFWKIFSFTELAKLWKCVALWLEWHNFWLDWTFGLLSFSYSIRFNLMIWLGQI